MIVSAGITKRLLRRVVVRLFRRRLGRPGQSPKSLVAYLPEQQRGWILDFLWRDLSAELRRIPDISCGISATPKDLWEKSRSKDLMVFAMSLDGLNSLVEFGFPPERIIFYHTHVRLGLELKKLDLLHAILVLNGFERELVGMQKVRRERIHLFSAGYDPKLFSIPDLSQPRPIDVLFVGRYRAGVDGYYHKRKRYGFQIALAQQLIDQGLIVAFLGGGWACCEYQLDPRVRVLEAPHSYYGSVYLQARLVCSVAAQEGGPVSFLEGLACGCLMVSAPTGFVSDLKLDDVACWTLPLIASEQDWADAIRNILLDHSAVSVEEQAAREKFLVEARFNSLAQKLVNCSWPSC